MTDSRCYLDAVSGQPWQAAAIDSLAAGARLSFAAGSGVHFEAATSRNLVAESLNSLAVSLGTQASDIIAVHGLGNACRIAMSGVTAHEQVAISSISRQGMLQAAKAVAPELMPLSVDGEGFLERFESPDVLIVQAGNPEVGTLDDLSALRAQHPKALTVVDATEWVGRMPSLPDGDIVIARASSWAGPSSVCFIITNSSLGRERMPSMNKRQRSMIAPDPVLLVAAATALENQRTNAHANSNAFTAIAQLRQEISQINDVDVHGHEISRLPHVLSFSVLHLDSEALASELDRRGFSVGSGSACLSDNGQPSHVLAAMKRLTHGNVRVSLPLDFDVNNVNRFIGALRETIDHLRTSTGVQNV